MPECVIPVNPLPTSGEGKHQNMIKYGLGRKQRSSVSRKTLTSVYFHRVCLRQILLRKLYLNDTFATWISILLMLNSIDGLSLEEKRVWNIEIGNSSAVFVHLSAMAPSDPTTSHIYHETIRIFATFFHPPFNCISNITSVRMVSAVYVGLQ